MQMNLLSVWTLESCRPHLLHFLTGQKAINLGFWPIPDKVPAGGKKKPNIKLFSCGFFHKYDKNVSFKTCI